MKMRMVQRHRMRQAFRCRRCGTLIENIDDKLKCPKCQYLLHDQKPGPDKYCHYCSTKLDQSEDGKHFWCPECKDTKYAEASEIIDKPGDGFIDTIVRQAKEDADMKGSD